MSAHEINAVVENDIDADLQGENPNDLSDSEGDGLQITVRKIEFPVKPRGVLAE